ncbi:MAG: SIR2 family protein [Bacteroidota bacterium]|nr:SIR2 family protein [Bacteroidota bacterium]MDP4257639.1 SIR2 family protein [Bacteroidota bacterium]
MPSLSTTSNKILIAGENLINDWIVSSNLHKLRTLIKNYLELDNVSFLFGAGSSIMLGSISIATIPMVFEDAIKNIPNHSPGSVGNEAYSEFLEIVSTLQKTSEVKRQEWMENGNKVTGNIDFPLESLLNNLTAIDFIQDNSTGLISKQYVRELIATLKEELFKTCDLETLPNNPRGMQEEDIKNLTANKFFFHEKFAKKILQRPLNLKRANIFTTNYDLAFDMAFDRLGIHYINGFSGFHKRTFKPETYDYDLFFPGSTTQGKVTRIEKVLKYYKIHGSLTWVQTEPTGNNVYGIEEWPIELVKAKREYKRLMIYPSAAKKSYTLDFPYSELFRHLASAITQPQSVLITFGYSFSDEHINDIIYQALTIPSFTLIIVDFKGTANPEIARLSSFKDPRIIILEGDQLGTFPFFVDQVLPDFIEENIQGKVAETLKNVYDNKDRDNGKSNPPAGPPGDQNASDKPREGGTDSTESNIDLPF